MANTITLISVSDIDQNEAGTPIYVSQGEYIVCDAVWTAASDAPTGTLKWQYSKDYIPARAASATWRDLENADGAVTFTTSPAGSAGSTAEVFEDFTGWVRPFYARTTGGTNESLTVTAERGYRR